MSDFDGQTVMVTGAARGIGRSVALLFAARGARVVAVDIDLDGAQAVAEECRQLGVEAWPIFADVTSSSSVNDMVAEAVSTAGRLHSLAHVAGIYPGQRLVDMTDELWQSVLNVNLTGTFFVCRAVARHMLERGGGSVVNISSGASMTPIVEMSAYSASKGGVNAFSRTIALELAPSVRVNVVAPGLTDVHDQGTTFAALTATVPMGRWARPQEIAEAVLYLASERASFITGQTLFVSGGRIMH